MLQRKILYVFAREPVAGRVKTRLCPPLSPEQAMRCHCAFVADTVDRLSVLKGVTLRVAATPDRRSPWLETLARRASVDLVWQGDGDLGARMQRFLGRDAETDAVVIVGADSPDLPRRCIRKAFCALAVPGTVLGPSDDGGYYLIGSTEGVPAVFALSAAWGSAAVLEETLTRLRATGRRFLLLPWWHDVDDYGALRRLALRVRAAKAAGLPVEIPCTAGLLDDLTREGIRL